MQQLGELVISTGADALSADELAGALIVPAWYCGRAVAAQRIGTLMRAIERTTNNFAGLRGS